MASRGVIPPEVFLIDIDFKCFYRKTVEIMSMICYTHIRCGVWRSLVARTAGGREVAGSNPVAPIKCSKGQEFPSFRKLFFYAFSGLHSVTHLVITRVSDFIRLKKS